MVSIEKIENGERRYNSMFDKLTNSFESIVNKIKDRGHISDDDIQKTMREIRVALLEADVSLSVVKEFVANVAEKIQGAELVKSITPGQLIIKLVYDELVEILGGNKETEKLESIINLKKKPSIIMLVGLQGTGKTTTVAKLAFFLKKKLSKKVLLASVDTYRPAAQLQLEKLAKQIDVEIYH